MEKHDDGPARFRGKNDGEHSSKTRFEIWGEEVIEKKVMPSAKSGRVYLPPDWVGHTVKIIRMD